MSKISKFIILVLMILLVGICFKYYEAIKNPIYISDQHKFSVKFDSKKLALHNWPIKERFYIYEGEDFDEFSYKPFNMEFFNRDYEAEKFLKVLKYYNADEKVTIGTPFLNRGNFTYFLSNGSALEGEMPDEYCDSFDIDTLKVVNLYNDGLWFIGEYYRGEQESPNQLYFYEKEIAEQALQDIKYYGFNQICSVGRLGDIGDTTYFRK